MNATNDIDKAPRRYQHEHDDNKSNNSSTDKPAQKVGRVPALPPTEQRGHMHSRVQCSSRQHRTPLRFLWRGYNRNACQNRRFQSVRILRLHIGYCIIVQLLTVPEKRSNTYRDKEIVELVHLASQLLFRQRRETHTRKPYDLPP